MHIVFYSTNDVFRAEELLGNAGLQCKIVQTPVQDKAYCGVCIETAEKDSANYLSDMEYRVLE